MKLTSRMAGMVQFARFAQNMRIDPADLARIIQFARRSKNAWERNDSVGELRAKKELENILLSYNYKCDWPGLWPVIVDSKGYSHFLPTAE